MGHHEPNSLVHHMHLFASRLHHPDTLQPQHPQVYAPKTVGVRYVAARHGPLALIYSHCDVVHGAPPELHKRPQVEYALPESPSDSYRLFLICDEDA